jgi:hypothetical protein
VDEGILIDVFDGGHEEVLELLFGSDSDVAQTERASLEKKPSIRLNQEPCLGVNVNLKRAAG